MSNVFFGFFSDVWICNWALKNSVRFWRYRIGLGVNTKAKWPVDRRPPTELSFSALAAHTLPEASVRDRISK